MRLFPFLTLLAFVLAGCITGATLAAPIQDRAAVDRSGVASRHEPDPQQRARRLARKLQLAPEQTARIETILQKRAQQIEQLRADGSMDEGSRRHQRYAIRQQGEQALRAVLSHSQLQQYQQLRQQARQRRLERKAPASGSSGGV